MIYCSFDRVTDRCTRCGIHITNASRMVRNKCKMNKKSFSRRKKRKVLPE